MDLILILKQECLMVPNYRFGIFKEIPSAPIKALCMKPNFFAKRGKIIKSTQLSP
jgi:hypothetical protein